VATGKDGEKTVNNKALKGQIFRAASGWTTFVSTYKSTWCYSLEDQHQHMFIDSEGISELRFIKFGIWSVTSLNICEVPSYPLYYCSESLFQADNELIYFFLSPAGE
jgi:hypothetical protein